MSTLCIDIGNTSAHYGLVDGHSVDATGHFPTDGLRDGPAEPLLAALEPLLQHAAAVAFCSVVPPVNDALRQTVASSGQPIFHLTHETCRGLELVYPKPAEIGQDRIANAIAAQAFFGTPAVVIDMGTAVTFDIVSSRGYEGGIIAPGLAVMRRYLHEQTALLPELSEEELVAVEGGIGKSTVEAMQLGVSVGFSGMIDALLVRVRAELAGRGEAPPVVLSTGGTTKHLTRDWQAKCRFVPNLTLMGLAEAARR